MREGKMFIARPKLLIEDLGTKSWKKVDHIIPFLPWVSDPTSQGPFGKILNVFGFHSRSSRKGKAWDSAKQPAIDLAPLPMKNYLARHTS